MPVTDEIRVWGISFAVSIASFAMWVLLVFKKEFVMARIFGVVPLELQPGVTGEDFVKFWLEEYAPLGQRLGWESHVLKGDRGTRVGQYAVIWEMPSVESRDRIVRAKVNSLRKANDC